MLIDMSVMPPIQAEYFKRLQMEIVAKKMYFFLIHRLATYVIDLDGNHD